MKILCFKYKTALRYVGVVWNNSSFNEWGFSAGVNSYFIKQNEKIVNKKNCHGILQFLNHVYRKLKSYTKVKVKVTRQRAMKAQGGSRSIVLILFYFGARLCVCVCVCVCVWFAPLPGRFTSEN